MSLLQIHKCTCECSFDQYSRCRVNGARHRCSEKCWTVTPQGERVCTWTGICVSGIGDAIDRSVGGNTPRTFTNSESAGGYSKGSVNGFVVPSRRKPEHGPGKNTPSMQARASRGRLPIGCPNTLESRNHYSARAQIHILFFREDVRKRVQQLCINKRECMFRASFRQRAKQNVGTRPDDATLWERCRKQYPMLSAVQAGELQSKLADACVDFLIEGWDRLCQTSNWQQPNGKRPDFESYVMGMIYMCREGGMLVEDYPLVPKLQFFETHTPNINDLTHFHAVMGEKDCRASLIGRRRIMEGRNAINATCHKELQRVSVAEIALRVRPSVAHLLTKNYCIGRTVGDAVDPPKMP